MFYLESPLARFQAGTGMKWLRVEPESPRGLVGAKLPRFKLTRGGGRLFRIKTPRWSNRPGHIKN